MDLLTNPLKSGKAEMEAAPMMQNPLVHGMELVHSAVERRRRVLSPWQVVIAAPPRKPVVPDANDAKRLRRHDARTHLAVGVFGAEGRQC